MLSDTLAALLRDLDAHGGAMTAGTADALHHGQVTRYAAERCEYVRTYELIDRETADVHDRGGRKHVGADVLPTGSAAVPVLILTKAGRAALASLGGRPLRSTARASADTATACKRRA